MSVQEDLQILRDARYGKDVRNALIDAITDIDGVAQTAMSYAAGARDSAQSYANEAKAWADGEGAESSDPQYHNNAKYYSEEADRLGQLQADQSEAWATGKIDGTDVPSTASQYHNNAKYFSEEADRLGAAQVALAAAEVDQAEAWATGEIDGTEVPSSAPQYHNNAKYFSQQVQNESENAEAWAAGTRGGTAIPSTDPAYENNAAYYKDLANYWYLQAKAIAEGFAGALLPMGTVAFANLPALADVQAGAMYNISDSFTTTADFEEGAGHVIPVGANVYKTNNGKWDILAGSPVSGVKGDKEVNYRQGNVNITPANVGAVAYFNDTDYQPVNQLAYNPTTKKLGLKVNGADTVIPFSGGGELYCDNIKQDGITVSKAKISKPGFDNWNVFSLVSSLPSGMTVCKAVVLGGKINILGGTSHYEWSGSAWTSVSTLPFLFRENAAVVLNNEIHIMGCTYSSGAYTRHHYKWNGSAWVSVSDLPYNLIYSRAVVLNGEIHIVGDGTNHYKLTGSTWTSVSILPYSLTIGGNAVVLNNEIHIMGGYNNYTNHYKWDGTTWTEVSTLPYQFNGKSIVFNNEIHIFGAGEPGSATIPKRPHIHYKWNGTNWIEFPRTGSLSDSSVYIYPGDIVTLNGEIYIIDESSMYKQSKMISLTSLNAKVTFGTANKIITRTQNSNTTKIAIFGAAHKEWDGSSWTTASTIPYNCNNCSAVARGLKVDILGGGTTSATQKNHYTWDRKSWSQASTLPYIFNRGAAVVLNNEIHILGGSDSKTKHYKWDGTTWTEVSTLPYQFYNGIAVVYNNEIHIMGGTNHNTSHYKWDGTTWTEVSTLPHSIDNDSGDYGSATCCAGIYIASDRLFVSFASANKIYQFDGTNWISVADTLMPALAILIDDRNFTDIKYFAENGRLYTTNPLIGTINCLMQTDDIET